MERQLDFVMRRVEERGVKLVRLWFTDVHGQLKSFAIPPAELEVAFTEGMFFDGSSIDGFSRTAETDVLARPDPNTFQLMSWSSGEEGVGGMFCDIETLDGTPFPGDSRQVLRRHLDKARELGFTFFVAPEMEYFVFAEGDPDSPLVPIDTGGFFDLTTADVASDIRRVTLEALEEMGIPVEYSFHENSPSQHEIDLRYTDALTMADSIVLFRLIVREVAVDHGVYATFMPQPLENVQGSGMHTHMSLFRGTENAFADSGDPLGLSEEAKHFMAGLLHHAREITAVTNSTVNSYKRLVSSGEAPVTLTWARTNWSALLRVPTVKKGKDESTRIELRSPDPACNPYLAFAVILAAGLKGITEEYELGSEAPRNLFQKTPYELRREGHSLLPLSLDEALMEMERSELVAEALGDHLFEWFLRNKQAEWAEYKAQVTPMELRRYLTMM